MTANNTYLRRKAAGLCVQCGKVEVAGVVRCLDCQTINNRRSDEIRKAYQEQGLCANCGADKERSNYRNCDRCTARMLKRITFRKLARKAVGT